MLGPPYQHRAHTAAGQAEPTGGQVRRERERDTDRQTDRQSVSSIASQAHLCPFTPFSPVFSHGETNMAYNVTRVILPSHTVTSSVAMQCSSQGVPWLVRTILNKVPSAQMVQFNYSPRTNNESLFRGLLYISQRSYRQSMVTYLCLVIHLTT